MEIYAYLLSINGAVVLLSSAPARRFIGYVGGLQALVVGCVSLILSQLAFLASTGFWALAASMVVFTLGEVLVTPSEYIVVDAITNDQNRGSYFGAHSLSTVGNFIGPALGGMMLGAFGGAGMFLLFSMFAGVSALLFSVGPRMPPPKLTTSKPLQNSCNVSRSMDARLGHVLA
jgi:MFS family permease